MLSLAFGSFLLALVLLFAVVQRNNASGLKQVPNAHFTVPFSRLWLLTVRWRSIENRTRIALHRRLGPVVRIGPREVSVDGVEDGIRLIYSSKFEKDESFYGAFADRFPPMFTMLGNEEHKKRRKMVSHVYSKSHVLSSHALDDTMSTVLGRFKSELAGWAKLDTSVEVVNRTKGCAFDIITGLIFGAENCTDTLRDQALRDEFSAMYASRFERIFLRCEFYNIFKLLRPLGISPLSKSARTAERRLQEWVGEMNAKAHKSHHEKSSPTATVYDHLYNNLTAANSEMAHSEANTIITVELDDHLVAGYEGTGLVLTYALYELSRSPETQRALRKEIRSLDEPSDRSLSQRIEDLPLLEAIVLETSRARSTNPGPWPRVVPNSGCCVAGRYDVPGGTIVSTSSWTLHNNSTLFPSPEKWQPERWLKPDAATVHEMRRWMWAFGSGARMCVGVHFATRVIKEMLVTVYADYETLVDENSTGDVEQMDALLAGPIGNRLDLKFRRCT